MNGFLSTGPIRLRAALVGVLVVRLALAVWLPFTGDEAYYYYWGVHPALAYYDHPPMVGWLMAPVVSLGMSPWWLRMPALLLVFFVAWAVRRLARSAGRERADLAALCVLLVPPELFNVLTTTDTPLVFFALASVVVMQKAVRLVQAGGPVVNRWHLVAGALLGAAFLSKYFAVLLGLAWLVHALLAPRAHRAWPGVIAAALAALPWALFNLWGNFEHCWLNILFNVENRHDNVHFSAGLMASYLGCLLYLTSPLILWALLRHALARWRQPGARAGQGDAGVRLVAWSFIVPVAVFGLVSTVRSVGLHWPLAFTPLAFALGALCLPAPALRADARYLAALSALHVAALAVMAWLPLETWRSTRLYDGLVLTVAHDEMLAALEPWRGRYAFATDGYSNSVTLGYQARRAHQGEAGDPASLDFLVFGPGSAHGRQQDVFDDWRALDGRDILVLRKTTPPHAEYDPFFRQVDYDSFVVRGVTYYRVLGQGFDYPRYRDTVLAGIRDRFYRRPDWLPAGACFFCQRYFDDAPAGAAAAR
jgi:4-amino-4-deoxy-L-arabinose transferase-like glycosyltransferase